MNHETITTIYSSWKLEDQQQDHIALNLSYRDIGMCNITSRTCTLMELDFRTINLVFYTSVLHTTQICKVKDIKISTKKDYKCHLNLNCLVMYTFISNITNVIPCVLGWTTSPLKLSIDHQSYTSQVTLSSQDLLQLHQNTSFSTYASFGVVHPLACQHKQLVQPHF